MRKDKDSSWLFDFYRLNKKELKKLIDIFNSDNIDCGILGNDGYVAFSKATQTWDYCTNKSIDRETIGYFPIKSKDAISYLDGLARIELSEVKPIKNEEKIIQETLEDINKKLGFETNFANLLKKCNGNKRVAMDIYDKAMKLWQIEFFEKYKGTKEHQGAVKKVERIKKGEEDF